MKKYLLIFAAAALVFAGCSKKTVDLKAESEKLFQNANEAAARAQTEEEQYAIAMDLLDDVCALLEANAGASYWDSLFLGVYPFLSDERKEVLFNVMPEAMKTQGETGKLYQDYKALKAVSKGAKFIDFKALTPEGEEVALSQFIGQTDYVLIDFWASWCGPCRRLIPVLKEIYRSQPKGHFQIFSCSVDQSEEAWRKALAEEEMPWPQAHEDAAHNGSDLYGVQYIPFTVLFDKEGTIVAVNPNEAELEEILFGE